MLERSQGKNELYGLLDMTVEKVSVTPKTSERTAWQREKYHHSFLVVCLHHQPAKHTEHFYSAEGSAFMISAVYISGDNGKTKKFSYSSLTFSFYFLLTNACFFLSLLTFFLQYMTARNRQEA